MIIKFGKTLANILVATALMIGGSSISVYADAGTNETISNYLSGDLTGKTIPGSIIKGTDTKDEDTYDRTKYNYYLGSDGNFYYVLKESEETAVQSIEKASKSAQVDGDIKEMTAGLGIEAKNDTNGLEIKVDNGDATAACKCDKSDCEASIQWATILISVAASILSSVTILTLIIRKRD